MRKLIFFAAMLAVGFNTYAGKGKKPKKEVTAADSVLTAVNNLIKFRDSVCSAMKYEHGSISLNGFAKLNINPGFKFLNEAQSQFIYSKVWGNPKRDDILGMIIPEVNTPYSDSSYFFIVSFDDMGYVKDKDADEINYDDMMRDMKKGEPEVNAQRKLEGYPALHFIGWAEKPFYDKNKRVLHWAKEINFEGDTENTLNYDVRILGRKGVLSLNAIASIGQLSLVNGDIDKVLNMAEFTDGNKYSDFNSSTDKIAMYTIGGLVAGKILAKVGLWALIIKFWKLIAVGVVGAFAGIKRFFLGKKKEETFV